MSFKSILITYFIGGLTLPPLVVISILLLLYKILPVAQEDDDKLDQPLSLGDNIEKDLKLTEIEENETSGVNAYKSGWITVTREYHAFISNVNDKQIEQQGNESKSAYTSLYKLVKNSKKDSSNNDAELSTNQSNSNSNNNNLPQKVRRKNKFFGILRHGNLFLYKDESRKDVQHVIVLSNNIVTMWPRNLADAELFTKRSAICLLKKSQRRRSDLPPKSSAASLTEDIDLESTVDVLESGSVPSKNSSFFIYADTNFEKEDWYFELIKATKKPNFELTGSEFDCFEPSIYADTLHFKTLDMISLIQTLHSSEGQLQTRWLNAIIGRLFLSLQHTAFFENIVRTKLLKKLAKINKPGFLEEFKVKKIDVGNSAPFISFPKLDDIKPDGSLRVSFKFSYYGKLSMQVATKANINLGSRFKTREFTILLAVTVNKIEGRMALVLKPPPSTRLWYTFETVPDIDLTVEPVVSQRQIKYSIITNVIENKLKNSIKDSLVEPAWDDINFYSTADEFYKGGIWDTSKRPEQERHESEKLDDSDSELEIDEFDSENLEDVDSAGIDNEDSSLNLDGSKSDSGSLKQKVSKLKGTYGSSVRVPTKSKTLPSIGTSEDQFLSNGSYVAKTSDKVSNPNFKEDEKSFKSAAMQIISEETNAGKKTISKSLKKIGQWYNDKNRGISSSSSSRDADYRPPEMITKRRNLSTSGENSDSIPRKLSYGDLASVGSSGTSGSLHKAAPVAHTFPTEYLHEIDRDVSVNNTSPQNISNITENNETHNLPHTSPIRRVPTRKPPPKVIAEQTSDEQSTGLRKDINEQDIEKQPSKHLNNVEETQTDTANTDDFDISRVQNITESQALDILDTDKITESSKHTLHSTQEASKEEFESPITPDLPSRVTPALPPRTHIDEGSAQSSNKSIDLPIIQEPETEIETSLEIRND